MLPLVAGIWLALEVSWGHEGGAAKKQAKDYWRKNLATYRDAKVPDLKHVDLHLDLFPERSRYHVTGTFDLVNQTEQPLREVLLTGGLHWEKLSLDPRRPAVHPDEPRRASMSSRRPEPLAHGQIGPDRLRARGELPAGDQQEGGRRHGVHPSLRPSC